MAVDPPKLKYPLVMIHGLGAKRQIGFVQYFYGIPHWLEEAGNRVFLPDLSLWNTLETRTQQLKEQIEKEFPGDGKLNLIGHSMGGVDARFVTSCLGLGHRVASVTTIGSPNRGTSLADMVVGLLPDDVFHSAERLAGKLGLSHEGFKQLGARYFNETLSSRIKEVPGVAYFSATSVIRKPILKTALPIFWLTERILRRYEGDNDGFVSESSSRSGESLGTWYGDHYGQVGQIMGRTRGLDHMDLFGKTLKRLSKEGF
ncbi:MAG TPA: hypothetical protein VL588_07720 [Bdellovibrionota bacterium]|jgi:triacylglycerol lipase|nr:hypothetical protein [Bdellovibrionota bacterium]